jgi:hypothetical protein
VGAVVSTRPLADRPHASAAGEPCDEEECIAIGEAVDLTLTGGDLEELAGSEEHAAESNRVRMKADNRSEADVVVDHVACDLLFEQTVSELVHEEQLHGIASSLSASGPVEEYRRKY